VHAGAFILSYLWVAVLGHVALSWARSLIGQGTARALIVLCYAAALGTQSWRVWSDRGLTPSKPWWDEGARPPTTAETIGTTTLAVLVIGIFAFVFVRWQRSRRAQRQVAMPAWAYVAVVAALGTVTVISSLLQPSVQLRLAITATALNLAQLALPLVPYLRRRLSSRLTRDVVAPRAAPADAPAGPAITLVGLQATLQRTLDDPGLRLYPVDEDGYRTVDGHRLGALPPPSARSRYWPVVWQGRKVAVLHVDEAWQEPPPQISAALGVVGVAVQAVRLQGLAARQTAEIALSRQRLVNAALTERRRIERDLHDGAQQAMFAVLNMIDDAEYKLCDRDDIPATIDVIRRAHAVTSRAITDLRRLTRGLYPAILTGLGLAAAVEELCDTSPLPVAASIPARRWPAHVEATAYFIITECLTNAVKHACATTIAVTVRETGDGLTVRVDDDGTGRIQIQPGGGLQHLQDRVTALGGDLHIQSDTPKGSTVTARIPIRGNTAAERDA
jgi:signal transduction histidine kinase